MIHALIGIACFGAGTVFGVVLLYLVACAMGRVAKSIKEGGK